VWEPQLRGLSDRFTVVAWDAPGAGQSDDPPDSYAIGDWADGLERLLDVEGLPRATICGLSWGGLLAQVLYQRSPDRVERLVLADTYAGWAGSLPDPMPAERLAACLRDSSLNSPEFVARYLPAMLSASPPENVRTGLASIMADFHPSGFRLMAAALARADTREILPGIRVPTLLIWGDSDVRSPLSVAHQMHDAIPDSALMVIPKAGHVSNLERPTEFNQGIRDWMSQASG
jgi:pimeloyl-ACP methyl ester carboxylesterase